MIASRPSILRQMERGRRRPFLIADQGARNPDRRPLGLATDRAGATAVEFALIAPVLFLFLVGGLYFLLAVFQYSSLTEGISTGARQLALSATDATPYSDTVTAIQTAAPALNTGQLTITVSLNGKACTSDASCVSLMAGGITAKVTGTYPCTLTMMGYDFWPSCLLSSTATEMTE
jgi:Flp pilus assembly protein TadG